MAGKTLVQHLAQEPLKRFAKTGPFFWVGMRFSKLLLVSSYVYEAAALLTRARSDKLDLLEEMLGEQEYEGPWTAYLQQQAEERLDQMGKEPTSFFSLVWTLSSRGLLIQTEFTLLNDATIRRRTRPPAGGLGQ